MNGEIKSRPSTPEFREHMDQIFGKPAFEKDAKTEKPRVCFFCGDPITPENLRFELPIENSFRLKPEYVVRARVAYEVMMMDVCKKHRLEEIVATNRYMKQGA